MDDQDSPGSFITLKTDIGERSFETYDELKEWYTKEANAWGWLQETIQKKHDATLADVWNRISSPLNRIRKFVDNFPTFSENPEELHKQKKGLQIEIHNSVEKGYTTTKSKEGIFILSLKGKSTSLIAGYALAFIKEIEVNTNSNAAIEGCYWGLQFRHGHAVESIAPNIRSLNLKIEEWERRLNKSLKSHLEERGTHESDLKELKDNFRKIIIESKNQCEESKSALELLLKESKAELDNIELVYDKKLALKSSVNYWINKRKHHQNVMTCMALLTLGIGTSTGAGFIWAAKSFLTEAAAQTPLWKLGVMLAISTFGIWMTRISSKIFISNLHLRTDADERVTMIQTYLALLREDNAINENERQLILQTLFRHSTSGIIKDEGPAGLYEMLAAHITKK
ncbi:hypothetical protein HCH_03741 [Hahella chejuensis KCTC 2396]|uniref:DUF6161 domain-containing protein n=1 Tax=Hahella chejuensis (strain KCTC 2396) TaxID=349521 RepID=Q2SFU9_HAHCH|nr:DUF6161 domain-containing protein [Hahella chejuensis]ABC30475.1 hypothetical protein HCH_03741 [Hahella chejuensis KCTC 2396]